MLNCILLIDDDVPTNYYHRIVAESSGLVNEIVARESAENALQYLAKAVNGQEHMPSAIFLDLNMPAMNGWEFLEALENSHPEVLESVPLIVLTTSENPNDQLKAEEHKYVSLFRTKPLTEELIEEVVDIVSNLNNSKDNKAA